MPRSDDNCRACGKSVGATGENHKWQEIVEDGRLAVFRLCLGCVEANLGVNSTESTSSSRKQR